MYRHVWALLLIDTSFISGPRYSWAISVGLVEILLNSPSFIFYLLFFINEEDNNEKNG